jgi:hypothetical protein
LEGFYIFEVQIPTLKFNNKNIMESPLFLLFCWFLPAFLLSVYAIKKAFGEVTIGALVLCVFGGLFGWCTIIALIIMAVVQLLITADFFNRKLF